MFSKRQVLSWRSFLQSKHTEPYTSGQLRIRKQRRSFASVRNPETVLDKPGDTIHGFVLERVESFPELELKAWMLKHKQTGMEYLHLQKDDPNNVFAIAFKTNPPDATGVPHILEHTVLCGSQKYPVRDPFFKMLPRSLSNFMNAMTSSDTTMYPFATTNRKDFHNLLSVYMDATLYPLLNESDFKQEGWRLGPEHFHENPQDHEAKAPNNIVFKGVVYNEMKGQMSDASYLFYIRFHELIAPMLNNSGGDPQRITDLTYSQLRQFHAEKYHPSNAKVFTYGDLPLAENAQLLSKTLQGFQRAKADTLLVNPVDISEGSFHTVLDGPIDSLAPLNKQYRTSTTWLLSDTGDIVERFALGLVADLLTDGYGSPMYRVLIESGLGQGFAPNTGFTQVGKNILFSIGAVGVEENNVPEVKKVIVNTIAEVFEEGFNKVKIDGILHQVELGMKHKTANFGLSMMNRLYPDWFNGIDPFKSLAVQSIIDEFRARYSTPRYLENLIEKVFLNANAFTFTMRPSETFLEQQANEERDRLAGKIHELTSTLNCDQGAVYHHLHQQELALVEEQKKPQDLSILPTLKVEDIPTDRPAKKHTQTTVGGVRVQWREAPTNGITYFRAINTFENLPNELRALVPLFTHCIMRLGTKTMTMEQLEEQMKLYVGDLSVSHHSATSVSNLEGYEEGIRITGYALDQNVAAMYSLFQRLILDTDFDSPSAEHKIRELLESSAQTVSDSINEAGNSYATRFAQSSLSPEARIIEQTAGLSQLQLTLQLSTRASFSDVIKKLKSIQRLALSTQGSLRVAITCGSESQAMNEQLLSQFLSLRPSNPLDITESDMTISVPEQFEADKTFISMPFQVSYVGLAIPGVPYDRSMGASLSILSQLLTYKYLHPEIRERGGAYGAAARYSPLSGIFTLSSYRDPNPANTLAVLKNAGQFVLDQTITDRDIDEAKISIFKSIDAPQSIHQEGMLEFEAGIDDAMQQAKRRSLFSVTAQDVKEAAEEFLLKGTKQKKTVVIGPKSPLKTELGWKTIENLRF